LWRGGKGRLGPTGLGWKSPLDARPALVLVPEELLGARVEPGRSPGGDGQVVVLDTTTHGPVTLAAEEPGRWAAALAATAAAESVPDAAAEPAGRTTAPGTTAPGTKTAGTKTAAPAPQDATR
jgi:hypothetical protein